MRHIIEQKEISLWQDGVEVIASGVTGRDTRKKLLANRKGDLYVIVEDQEVLSTRSLQKAVAQYNLY